MSISESPDLLERDDYLPFGTRIADGELPVMGSNRWRYAGKEEQAPVVGEGCSLLDFGARTYDPWCARWTTVDPMAALYHSSTPYSYCLNNPIRFADPIGLWTTDDNNMLIQEEGDDVSTLSDYLNISLSEAQVIFDSQCYKMLDDGIYPAYCSADMENSDIFLISTGIGVSIVNSAAKPYKGYTFYIGDSYNKRNLYYWESGWNKGNQYIPNNRIHSLKYPVKSLSTLNTAVNILNLYNDLQKLDLTSENIDDYLSIVDVTMDAVAFVPYLSWVPICYQICGGKKMIKAYVELNMWNTENGFPTVHLTDY